MNRVALVSSEPIREQMAGIGIRYLELARRLPAHGLDTVLLSPSPDGEAGALGVATVAVTPETLADRLEGFDVVVVQGQLANEVVIRRPDLSTVVDLYDPFLVENFHYLDTLGLDPYRNDHASWVLQLSRGDFFLCSSEEQRLFYLGFLTALGRVNPENAQGDPDLEGLIAAVPFGVPDSLPVARTLLPARREGERRILFGGLYDWYDPWTLLEALSELPPEVRLFFVSNPNAGTPQRLLAEVRSFCEARGWWGDRVEALPWIPSERRFDLLREVDVLAAPHRPSLETRLSLRTRFLDALAAGCPVITSVGGAIAGWVDELDAGWVVPPGDAESLVEALRQALDGGEVGRRKAAGSRRLVERFTWDRVLQPLVAYCRDPRRDPTRERFSRPLATEAPADGIAFRVRRRLRRFWGGAS